MTALFEGEFKAHLSPWPSVDRLYGDMQAAIKTEFARQIDRLFTCDLREDVYFAEQYADAMPADADEAELVSIVRNHWITTAWRVSPRLTDLVSRTETNVIMGDWEQ